MFRRFARITGQLPGIANRSVDKDYGGEKAAAFDYQVCNDMYYCGLSDRSHLGYGEGLVLVVSWKVSLIKKICS